MSEYCKYCGQKYNDARSLLTNSCLHHSDGRGKLSCTVRLLWAVRMIMPLGIGAKVDMVVGVSNC